MKIINVVGARPNFMKIAPLMAAYARVSAIEPLLVHTGQHYDQRMSDLFFRQLGIPEPQINLGIGTGSAIERTARIMTAFEQVILEHRPDAVLVVGDVDSTIACGLVAVKLRKTLIHVEAGLRSGDRSMPEEINRIATDSISDLLFCTEQSGVDNLLQSGTPAQQIFMVGNVMIDTLLKNKARAQTTTILQDLGLEPDQYAVLTLHRPANVDNPAVLGRIFDALEIVQRDMPLIFPIHPRTAKNLQDSPLGRRIANMPNLRLIEPVGYLEFLKLMSSARIVLTDSGGIQEETTILKVPCLTLRENTERPITIHMGSNQLVGTDPDKILAGYHRVISKSQPASQTPPLWDGHAAERIVDILARQLC